MNKKFESEDAIKLLKTYGEVMDKIEELSNLIPHDCKVRKAYYHIYEACAEFCEEMKKYHIRMPLQPAQEKSFNNLNFQGKNRIIYCI